MDETTVIWISVALIVVGVLLGAVGASVVRLAFVLAEHKSAENSLAGKRQFTVGRLVIMGASATCSAGVMLLAAKLLGVF